MLVEIIGYIRVSDRKVYDAINNVADTARIPLIEEEVEGTKTLEVVDKDTLRILENCSLVSPEERRAAETAGVDYIKFYYE